MRPGPGLLAGGRQSPQLPVLHHGLADPAAVEGIGQKRKDPVGLHANDNTNNNDNGNENNNGKIDHIDNNSNIDEAISAMVKAPYTRPTSL